MSEDKKVTKLEEYRAKKFVNIGPDIDRTYTPTEENLLKLIDSGNELVSFDIKEKNIRLTFYDNSVATDIEFYIDDNGNIETKLKSERLK